MRFKSKFEKVNKRIHISSRGHFFPTMCEYVNFLFAYEHNVYKMFTMLIITFIVIITTVSAH